MTTTRNFYRATATRSGRWWAVVVPAVPGALTQGPTLKAAAAMAREAVALVLDIPEESVVIDLRPELPDTAATALNDFRSRRSERERAEEAEREAQATAAQVLREAGLSVRDAGEVLGVSHQRVSQLAPKKAG